jgi:hypothetical protein
MKSGTKDKFQRALLTDILQKLFIRAEREGYLDQRL